MIKSSLCSDTNCRILDIITQSKGNMGAFVDHYIILGLSSGEEGSKVSKEEIRKAYLKKACKLHPDKRSDHPNDVTDFQQLQAS
nr:DnaJ homolog subfamily C member 17-like [Tanacetum cinerariifolium]